VRTLEPGDRDLELNDIAADVRELGIHAIESGPDLFEALIEPTPRPREQGAHAAEHRDDRARQRDDHADRIRSQIHLSILRHPWRRIDGMSSPRRVNRPRHDLWRSDARAIGVDGGRPAVRPFV